MKQQLESFTFRWTKADRQRCERAARKLPARSLSDFVRAAATSVASQTLYPAAVEFTKPDGARALLPLTGAKASEP
jgi:uncharacterized protein (DUF1778 family)